MTVADERYQLPEELRMARNLVRDYIKNEIVPLEQDLDQDAISLPDEDFNRLTPLTKEMGLWCIGVDEKYGGAGLSIFAQAVIDEEMVQHRAGLYRLTAGEGRAKSLSGLGVFYSHSLGDDGYSKVGR